MLLTPKNLVNHRAKTMAHFYRKNTVKVEFQGSKVSFWGSNLYGPRLFIDSNEIVKTLVNNRQKDDLHFNR